MALSASGTGSAQSHWQLPLAVKLEVTTARPGVAGATGSANFKLPLALGSLPVSAVTATPSQAGSASELVKLQAYGVVGPG